MELAVIENSDFAVGISTLSVTVPEIKVFRQPFRLSIIIGIA